MITFLSHRIALFLRDNEIVDEETSQICQYGFEIIISTFIGFLLVISIGICFCDLFSSILFYAIFVGVRLSTGGYHASTHFKCKILLGLCCTFTLLAIRLFLDYYSFIIQSIIVILYLLSVIILSPIEHPNAPVDDFTLKRNRSVSIIVSLVLSVLVSIGYSEFKKMAMIVSVTLLVVSFLMVLSKLTERRKN